VIGFRAAFLVALLGGLVLRTWLSLREQSCVLAHSDEDEVPSVFGDRFTTDTLQKAAAYAVAKHRLAILSDIMGVLVLFGWTLAGGLNWLAVAWSDLIDSQTVSGVALLVSVVALDSLPGIALSAYRVFRIEQRFGFNRTTPGLFLVDLVKGAVLLAALGLVAATVGLWLIGHGGRLWWVIAWAGWAAFSFFLSWAFPVLIAPLFNKFRPLDDAVLSDQISALLSRNGFRTAGVFVIDGSRRSTHGNAYFTGVGRSKRVVFFDTLLTQLDRDETVAVLAHELGHYRRHHIQKQLFLGMTTSFVTFALVAWVLGQGWFYSGLGVDTRSNATALALLLLAGPTLAFFLSPVFAGISRRFEAEADDFAVHECGADAMASALIKLYDQNATPLATDPVYSAFYDSHPPPAVRLQRLRAGLTETAEHTG
jgi:STE24 endopeptidase